MQDKKKSITPKEKLKEREINNVKKIID